MIAGKQGQYTKINSISTSNNKPNIKLRMQFPLNYIKNNKILRNKFSKISTGLVH